MIEENITDIDSVAYPAIEFDLTPGAFWSTKSPEGFWYAGVETEWRFLERAGVGLELDSVGSLNGLHPVGATHFVPRGALSYVLIRDVERRLFLQAEVGARYDDGLSLAFADATEFAQPCWAGLREALKLGPMDLRAGAFGEFGGASARAPVRWSGAALYSIAGASVRGALGAEMIVVAGIAVRCCSGSASAFPRPWAPCAIGSGGANDSRRER